ncbi:ComEA family DNA-binding protein [Vibrio sp.]|uniref:ComEA family DNA-binding protein n=1 Tax=Vibrio sp. TaxID=678 RepID=UPI003D0D29E4
MKLITCLLPLMLTLTPATLLAADSTTTEQLAGIEITVNINNASADELATLLKGVGQSKAQAIVDYRNDNGEFETIDDLAKVKGIGNATVDKNRSRIKL